jgi:chromate transporter
MTAASVPDSAPDTIGRTRLRELIALFLKLGATSFGGPAGHIALMEHEVVSKRRWLTRDYFLDLLAATNLVPGPNALEMAHHIGYVRAGWAGLVASGAAFLLPSFVITLGLAWAYVRFGAVPEVGALLYGLKPAVLGIIIMAVWRLGRSAVVNTASAALFGVSLAAAWWKADDVLLMLAAGLLMIAWHERSRLHPACGGTNGLVGLLPLLARPAPEPRAAALAAVSRSASAQLSRMFLFFLKIGSVLYGSGLVLYALIQRDVVVNFGWLSQQQFIDAIAAGQVTPGPVLSSATFIGYLIAGTPGAVVATLGIFLPSFFIIALTGPLVPRLRGWKIGKAFLEGASVAAVALILRTGFLLGRSALVDAWTIAIALASTVLLWRYDVDAFWVIAAGATAGLLRFLAAGA